MTTFFTGTGSAFKLPTNQQRFKDTVWKAITTRASADQNQTHSHLTDRNDAENPSEVENVVLEIVQEAEDFENGKTSITQEKTAKHQQLKKISDKIAPPPGSMAENLDQSLATGAGCKKVLTSLTTTAVPSETNISDGDIIIGK